MTIATVILAAGGSTRMGRAKQLLPIRERPMVAHAAWTALSASLGPVIVVVGAHCQEVVDALRELPIQVCDNPRWQVGMGSSIGVGVGAADADPEVTGIIIMLADQPLVDRELLLRLAAEHPGSAAVACRYGDSVGVPALFNRSLFARLAALPDGQGAKHLLHELGDALSLIDAPQAGADIDTPDDYRRLILPNQA